MTKNQNLESGLTIRTAEYIYNFVEEAINLHNAVAIKAVPFVRWNYQFFPDKNGGIKVMEFLLQHKPKERKDLESHIAYWQKNYKSIRRELVNY
ncbi:MAG: hypothetical protein AABX66_01265 [Nanoarchaeota archaeon]